MNDHRETITEIISDLIYSMDVPGSYEYIHEHEGTTKAIEALCDLMTGEGPPKEAYEGEGFTFVESAPSLESRLSALEAEVARLRECIAHPVYVINEGTFSVAGCEDHPQAKRGTEAETP